MNESGKRREWVKNAAIIFLSVLLVLTFCSNTIMNYSLPEVAAQYCNSGSITNKVRGDGVVESAEPYTVFSKDSRKVTEVKVKVGDEVKKGDVLFILEEGESDAVKEAEKAVKDAKTEYEKAIIDGGYSKEETKAIEEGTESEKSVYQDEASKLNKAKEATQKALDAIEEEIEDYKYYTVDKWKDGTSEEAKALNEKIELAEETMEETKDIMDSYEKDYESYKDAYEAYAKADEEYKKAKEAYEKKQTDANEEKKAEAKTAYKKAKEALDEVADSKEGYEKYCVAYQSYYSAKQTVTDCKKYKEDKDKEMDEVMVAYEDKQYDAKKKAEAASKALEEFTSNYSGDSSLSDLYKAVQEAEKALEKTKEEAGKKEVNSPVTGTVLSLKKIAGEKMCTGDEAEEVATIQLAGKGFTLSFNVTNEQARYLSVGDEAEVSNSWWYSDVHAKITSIRTDPTDPTAGKKVTFQLDGDITNGQSLTLIAGKRTANYDCIVPNSAIREDNDGKFILKVEQKSTPLGNRYTARRVDVKVLAEDDNQSAVSGILEGWEYVITTASKPVEDGQLVRLKEQ